MDREGHADPNFEAVLQEWDGFLRSLAARYCPPYAVQEEDDLYVVGAAALYEAWQRWDPALSVNFLQFLTYRVKGAMLDEVRRTQFYPRSHWAIRKTVERLDRHARLCSRSPPTDETYRAVTGLSRRQWANYQEALAKPPINASALDHEGEETTRRQITIARDPSPDALTVVMQRETTGTVRDALWTLTPEQVFILIAYYWADQTFLEIGRVLGVTESCVWLRHKRACQSLRFTLAACRDRTGEPL